VTSELLILSYVQQIALDLLPGDPEAVSRVSDMAIRSYAGGASVSEACRDARLALRSMARHPSRPAVTGVPELSPRPTDRHMLSAAAMN